MHLCLRARVRVRMHVHARAACHLARGLLFLTVSDTVRARLGPDTPIPHLHTAGAHATPGSGLPFVGLSAALVAERIGPA